MKVKMNIPESVMVAVKAADEEKKRQEWRTAVTKAVAYKQAVVVPLEGLDVETAKSLYSKDLMVIPVENNKGENTGLVAVFNGTEIDGREDRERITMEVPAGKVGLVMGAGKWQLKDWAHTAWLRRRGVRWINPVEAGTYIS